MSKTAGTTVFSKEPTAQSVLAASLATAAISPAANGPAGART